MFAYYNVLRRNPEYAKLWLAQVISLTGDWFNTVALLGYLPVNLTTIILLHNYPRMSTIAAGSLGTSDDVGFG